MESSFCWILAQESRNSRVSLSTIRMRQLEALEFKLSLELHGLDQEVLRHSKTADERAEFDHVVLFAYFRRRREQVRHHHSVFQFEHLDSGWQNVFFPFAP